MTTSRQLVVSLLFATVLAPAAAAQEQPAHESQDADQRTLERLLVESLASFPSIDAAWAEVEAMGHRGEQVSQPFDPMVTFGVNNVPLDSFAFDSHGMTGLQFGLREQFYWPGVLDAREQAADAAVETRRAAIPEMSIRVWRSAVMP